MMHEKYHGYVLAMHIICSSWNSFPHFRDTVVKARHGKEYWLQINLLSENFLAQSSVLFAWHCSLCEIGNMNR